MINSKTLKEFQKELGSKTPNPGGGVVAALAGSFSASLIEMVCSQSLSEIVSLRNKKEILKIHKEVVVMKKKLNDLANEDIKVFQKIKQTEKTKDKESLKKVLKHAIEIPTEVRRISQELESFGFKMTKLGVRGTIQDSKTAVHLARAASKSALENIKVYKVKVKDLN